MKLAALLTTVWLFSACNLWEPVLECAGSADCLLPAKPICAANACRACEGDPECVAKLGADPGVCMGHEDGRCATAADTVFVENLSSKCAAGPGAGSAAMPFCGLQQGVDAAKAQGKPLVVLKGPGAVDRATWSGPGKVSVVGKAGALVRGGAGPGFQATGGEVYLRDLKLEAGDPGLKVTTGGTLRVDNARVVNNPGGGVLVEGGKLVLERTLVSGNGPAPFPAWGGIFMQSPAPGTRLERVSVTDNEISGISCSSAVAASGVLSTGHGNSAAANITPTCGFTSCGAPSANCGAP